VTVGVSGTGISSADYDLSNTTITIPDGETTGSVTIDIQNDSEVEGEETATLTLSSPSSGIALGSTTTQSVTIADDDSVAWTVSGGQVIEGDSGSNDFVFNVTLLGATSLPASVNYTTVDGSATAGSDYTAQSDTISFTSSWDEATQAYLSSVSQSVRVPILGDTANEGDETFTLTLSNPTGSTLGDASAQVTILDEDDGSANNCATADSIFHSTTYTSNFYCNAATRIRAGTNLTVASGAHVIYSSPLVNLLPGTTIEKGATFRAGQGLANPFAAERSASSEAARRVSGTEATNEATTAWPVTSAERIDPADFPAGLQHWFRDHPEALAAIRHAWRDGEGEWIVFATDAPLLSNDGNGLSDVYLYRDTGNQLELVSQGIYGQAGEGASDAPALGEGTHSAAFFHSDAADLVHDDANAVSDLFRYDLTSGLLQNLTREATTASSRPTIDSQGEWLYFERMGEKGLRGIQRLDLISGTLTPLSDPTLDSHHPRASADGRYLLWRQGADTLVYSDQQRGTATAIPAPPEFRDHFETLEARFINDGAVIEWRESEEELRWFTDNPL
jgi:hypothetical protein